MNDSKDQNQENIPKITDKWPEKIWSMVEQEKQGSHTFALAPMEEIYADPNQCEFDTNFIYGYIGSTESQESIDEDLKEMLQYLGEHEIKLEKRVLPSVQGRIK